MSSMLGCVVYMCIFVAFCGSAKNAIVSPINGSFLQSSMDVMLVVRWMNDLILRCMMRGKTGVSFTILRSKSLENRKRILLSDPR